MDAELRRQVSLIIGGQAIDLAAMGVENAQLAQRLSIAEAEAARLRDQALAATVVNQATEEEQDGEGQARGDEGSRDDAPAGGGRSRRLRESTAAAG